MTGSKTLLPLLFLAALTFGGLAHAEPRGSKTPEGFFELYKRCYDAKSKSFSYAKLYDLSSKDSQVLWFMRASQEASAATRGPKFKVDEAKLAQLNALLREHGLDPEQKPLEGGPDMTQELAQKLFKDPELMVAHLRKLLAPAKDQGKLIKALFAFAQQKGKARPKPEPIEVKELKAYRGHASGKIVEVLEQGRETMKSTGPYCLVKEKGRWVYDLVAIMQHMFSQR